MRALALALLLLATATLASAQTGWIEGRVTDGEKPVPYANVLLVGSQAIGAMTDDAGRFRFRAPCGRFAFRVLCMGYRNVEEPVTIRRNETTQVNVVLERIELSQEVLRIRFGRESSRRRTGNADVPWWRPVWEAKDALLESREVDEVVEQVGRRAGLAGDWTYTASTAAVRQGDLEYVIRYVMAEQGDSVVVNVIAEGRNTSRDPVTVCGCFSLWDTRYKPVFSKLPLGPARTPAPGTVFVSLDVPPLECDGSRFQEAPRVLLPGETIARGMAFSFYPRAFAEHPGELWVYAVFFSGHRGDGWEDTDLVDLGAIEVPIRPIGMPMRR